MAEQFTWTPVASGSSSLKETRALAADPFGVIPEGAFFGNPGLGTMAATRPAPGLSGRKGRPAVILPLRHAPTPATLTRLNEVFGTRAATVLEDWRELWERVAPGRVEPLARELGARRIDAGEAMPDTWRCESTTSRTARRLAGAAEASYLFALERLLGEAPARDGALHALEDAAYAGALARAGVSWSYASFDIGAKIAQILPMSRGKGRLRRLDEATSMALFDDIWRGPEYWKTRAFLDTCGRQMQEAEDAPHAAMILLDMARQGHTKAFAKHCVPKNGTWTLDLTSVATPRDALAALALALGRDAFGAAACGRWRGAGFLLIQTFRRFAYETRFFIVRGRIIATTPSDRFLSVLDRHEGPGRLDPRVAALIEPPGLTGPYDRGMTRTETRRPLAAAMTRKVRAFLEACRRDPVSAAIMGHAYIVDAGATAVDAEPELIEINRFRSAGLYAVDVERLAAAVADAGSWPQPLDSLAGLMSDPRTLAAYTDPDRIMMALQAIVKSKLAQ